MDYRIITGVILEFNVENIVMPIALIVGLIIAVLVGVYAFTQSKSDTVTLEEPVVRVEDTTTPTDTEVEDMNTDTVPVTDVVSGESMNAVYADGIYSAEATYLTPRRTEHIVSIELTIENDVVTASNVTFDGKVEGESSNDSQARFADTYTTEIIGMKLDDISLARVGGASLTSMAFNDAKAKIAAEAAL